MLTCPNCNETFVHGQIVCPNCGADLDEPAPRSQLLPVLDVNESLLHVGPTITLHVIEVDNTTFPEGTYVATIPVARLEIPVRIGRLDLKQDPPIVPELNLGAILADLQPEVKPVVSRLHAALQLQDGHPVIKPLVDHINSTWVRHTGENRISPVPVNTLRRLEHRDCILLGNPRGRHVALRVILSHP